MAVSFIPPHEALPTPRYPRSEVIEAVMQTGTTETRYHRAGHGPTVLLLCAGGMDSSVGTLLTGTLVDRFRVVAPLPPVPVGSPPRKPLPSEAVPLSTWFRHLTDGLGLIRPSIVADREFGVAALAFALMDPERVARLVLVRSDSPDLAAPEGGHADALERSRHPLLLLRVDPEVSSDAVLDPVAREELVHFLLQGVTGGA